MIGNKYKIRAKVWLYPDVVAAWNFVTVPRKLSKEIMDTFEALKRGWGSLPVKVTIGKMSWKTSIFPDKKAGGYLIPLKAEVRKREGIKVNDTISIDFEILA